MISRIVLISAVSFLVLVGCEKDQAGSVPDNSGTSAEAESTAAPAPEDLIQPRFSIEERHEFEARIEMERVMKSAQMGERSQPSEPLVFNLTVEPKDDEVHFLWTSPEVEKMPDESDEDKTARSIAAFQRMWSPSFAVSKQGKFLRILAPEAIRAGFDASMQARIDAGADPEQVKQMAESNDPIEVMEEVGQRRWSEIVGHFLVNEFVKGDTVKAAGAEYLATPDIDCISNEAGGDCVRFFTNVPVSRQEVQESIGSATDRSTRVKEARREVTLVAKPGQMLPWYSESVLHLELEVDGRDGTTDQVTSRTIERIDLSPRDVAEPSNPAAEE